MPMLSGANTNNKKDEKREELIKQIQNLYTSDKVEESYALFDQVKDQFNIDSYDVYDYTLADRILVPIFTSDFTFHPSITDADKELTVEQRDRLFTNLNVKHNINLDQIWWKRKR
jgi:hypothetical protein